jgi:hypothetical protein
VGIIACVQVTTTTTTTPITTTLPSSTTPITTTPPSSVPSTMSGTTTLPTSVQTATTCQKDMAQVGSVYVSSVTYSVQPVQGTNNADLTSTTGNGIGFPQPIGTTGLFNQANQPIYSIIFTFNPSGVNSLSSVIANANSNVDKFSVEFFGLSNPNELITYPTGNNDIPVSYNSTLNNSQASLTNFPSDAPSDLSGIRIIILSTTDNA